MEGLKSIEIKEQEQVSDEDLTYIKSLNIGFPESITDGLCSYLGLNKDGYVSYYVGATWLKENVCTLTVLPKFPKLDFMSIFYKAIHSDIHPDYFESAYKIDLSKPLIKQPGLTSIFTPLVVAHYICVVRKLLEKGLKRNYILREENLNAKVKGHIMTLKNLQKNVISGHSERVLCRYQEYSIDYPENQLLKRALLAAESMLVSLLKPNIHLLSLLRKELQSFEGVSSNITPSAVKNIRKDKLHGEYPMAIKLAKLILKRTDFSIRQNGENNQYVPVFSIDMSKIFEFHVLSLLTRKYGRNNVLFQVDTKTMGRCDYLIPSEQLIVDAKYKAIYDEREMSYKLADIREVAGYGRSKHVLDLLQITDEKEPNCLIIYPKYYSSEDITMNEGPILDSSKQINGVVNFYTLDVKLPSI